MFARWGWAGWRVGFMLIGGGWTGRGIVIGITIFVCLIGVISFLFMCKIRFQVDGVFSRCPIGTVMWGVFIRCNMCLISWIQNIGKFFTAYAWRCGVRGRTRRRSCDFFFGCNIGGWWWRLFILICSLIIIFIVCDKSSKVCWSLICTLKYKLTKGLKGSQYSKIDRIPFIP